MKNLRSIFILSAFAVFSITIAEAQVISIAEARALPEDTEVTVSGVTTNGDEMGIIRYLQDGSGGIAAYGSAVDDVMRYDSITVTGILKDYNGLLELDPIISIENHGPAQNPISPELVTPNQLTESREGQLVYIENAVFADGGSTFAVGNYNFSSNGQSAVIYIRGGHPLIDQFIPVGPVQLTGILSQFTYTGFGGYQLLPRDENDMVGNSNLNIISSIDQSNMSQTGFTISWNTDMPSSTDVFYTAYPNADFTDAEHISIDESVTAHELELEDLEAGEIYFVRAFSVAGEDTAISNIAAFATVSNSSGDIKVYFNNVVDHSVATSEENESVWTSHIADTIASYIDMAMVSLDLAIYNTNNSTIINAVNAAVDRGVDIRYIAEGGNANIGLSSLDNSINTLLRQNALGSGMHNKFVVIDAETEDNSWIITGSTNFTPNNLFDDYNNMIVVQDQSLAKAYTLEFNEMWGSSTTDPNESESKFGPEKTNNTPHKFLVDNKEVELFFSPSDGTSNAIAEVLNTTNVSVDFALLVLTRDDLAELLIEKNNNFFINVRGIIEQTSGSGSDFQELLDSGVDVISHEGIDGQIHHKYAIIDHADLSSDPIVLTGSHNWSASAETDNDENTLIVHDADIANQYYQEFMARFSGMQTALKENSQSITSVYPNPATDILNIEYAAETSELTNLQLFDISGKLVHALNVKPISANNRLILNVNELPAGFYTLTITSGTKQSSKKIIIAE